MWYIPGRTSSTSYPYAFFSEGFGVEGILELETEDLAVGEEGKLDTVAEGSMPGDGAGMWCIFGHDGPPYIYRGAAVHGTWVFG
jgi:hypothetical protein